MMSQIRGIRWRLFLAGLLFLLGCANVFGQNLQGRVAWVYDGDTIEVAGVGKVRLIGIDTPEREDSERDHYYRQLGIPRKKLRRMAREALQFNIDHVKGSHVCLDLDDEKRDRYGRLLAYVVLPDGRVLNRLLLEKGYAVVYRRFDFRLKQDFLAAEAEARQKKVGLWQK